MFKRIKQWFNSPINKDSFFGSHIKRTYQFFRDFKKKPELTQADIDRISKEVKDWAEKSQINAIPHPFDDSSFLNELRMEIQSKIVFLGANKHLYINADIYIEKYENLIKCLDDLISITDMKEKEVLEMFPKDINVKKANINDGFVISEVEDVKIISVPGIVKHTMIENNLTERSSDAR